MQGESFKNSLINKPFKQREAIYYHYYEYPRWHKVQPHYGVSNGDFKLIHYYYNMDHWELFDLKNDPDEIQNLYKQDGYAAITSNLKKEIKRLQVKYQDTMSLEAMRAMTDVNIKRVYEER